MRVALAFCALLGLSSCSSTKSESPQAPPLTIPDEAGAPPIEGGAAGTDYVILTADSLASSADKYRAYRESAGYRVAVAKLSDVGADGLVAYVKATYAKRDVQKPFFVMILGDASAKAHAEGEVPPGTYDDHGTPVTTDNVYADMDGDHLPDLAVGRIAVRTTADADAVLEKTRRYEATYEVGPWNRRVDLFASTSGFGELVDPLIEEMVFKIVDEIPYELDISLTYAKQSSPYVFVPEHFSDKIYDRLNQGSLMMAYVGHGDTTGFATLDWSGRSFPILDTRDLATKIAAVHRPPIMTLIACLTGGFEKGESLSEVILKTSNGPSAILSSTEVSHPYPNAIFIREIGQVLSKTRLSTIGEVFMQSKRRMITEKGALRQEIDQRVGRLVAPADRITLKQSHLHMYTLFGDPALRIAYVHGAAAVVAPATAKAGQALTVTATIPAAVGDGKAAVTFERSRLVDSPNVKPVPADGTDGRDAVIEANYATSNDRAVVSVEATYSKGTLTTSFLVPEGLAAGRYYVKVYADDGKTDAMGSAPVDVTP